MRHRHLVEALEALQFALIITQVPARLGALRLQAGVIRPLGQNAVTHRALIGLRLRQGNAVGLGVDLGEHLATPHRLVALHVHRHQRAADVGGQRDHVDFNVGVLGAHVAVAAEYQPQHHRQGDQQPQAHSQSPVALRRGHCPSPWSGRSQRLARIASSTSLNVSICSLVSPSKARSRVSAASSRSRSNAGAAASVR